VPELKALMTQNQDLLQPLVQWLLQEVLEQEMRDVIGAAKSERTAGRQGRFSTQFFERYQRSEKALVAALLESSGAR